MRIPVCRPWAPKPGCETSLSPMLVMELGGKFCLAWRCEDCRFIVRAYITLRPRAAFPADFLQGDTFRNEELHTFPAPRCCRTFMQYQGMEDGTRTETHTWRCPVCSKTASALVEYGNQKAFGRYTQHGQLMVEAARWMGEL